MDFFKYVLNEIACVVCSVLRVVLSLVRRRQSLNAAIKKLKMYVTLASRPAKMVTSSHRVALIALVTVRNRLSETSSWGKYQGHITKLLPLRNIWKQI